jgi:predicted translin family RNA/ssDNA-binding protein
LFNEKSLGGISALTGSRMASKGANAVDIEEIFGRVGSVLSKQDETRERIRGVRDDADTAVRSATRALASLHIATADLQAPADKIVRTLPPVGAAIAAVEAACPDEPGAFYQYHDIWRDSLQNAVYVCVVLDFIRTDTLASNDRVVELLGASVRIPLEDYLWGVCHAISELPRLAMNRVTIGDYSTPKRCAIFSANIFEAFKQLNFRNDFLRKKYDGMKYDVKRIEEIMYDLSIRGLVKDVDGQNVAGKVADQNANV